MDENHLTRDLFRAIVRGELHPRVALERGLAHILSLCPHCRAEYQAWRQETGALGAPAESAEYGHAFARVATTLSARLATEERAKRETAHDLRELFATPPERRIERVKRARSRFRGDAFARALLAASWERRRDNPNEAFQLAELARLVVNHSPASPASFDLTALATAQMANAKRSTGDLVEADAHFRFVRYLEHREHISDLGTLARLDDLEGSLRKDQRRLTEAHDLLQRAAKAYRSLNDRNAQARVLVNLGDVLHEQGDLPAAIITTQAALKKLTLLEDPSLYLCARYNLAYYSFLAGDQTTTAQLLAEDRPLYKQSNDHAITLRYDWLVGDLALARGERRTAEAVYLATRKGFIERGIGYDAAIISLDLAALYLEEGRTAEVKELADSMFPIFEAQDVHREALAALLLFQHAARQEVLSATAAREVGNYLREARTDPNYQFRKPS